MKWREHLPRTLRHAKELLRPFYLKWFYFHLSGSTCPAYFRECWDFPREIPGPRIASERGAESPIVFVFLPMSDWHTRIQRTQHLARELGRRGHRCLYLNPHLGREFPSPYPWSERRAVARLDHNVFELHVHLPREPVYHDRCLTDGEAQAVASSVAAALDAMESSQAAVIVSLPTWKSVALGLRAQRGSPVIYDCHDWIEGFGNMAREVAAAERPLMEAADAVLFSSAWLSETHVRRHPSLADKSMIVRNAVDASMFPFRAAPRGKGDRPCIGYAGSLASWVDFKMIRAAAREHPGWRFLLIGRPECPEVETLRDCPNIQLTGEIPHAALAGYFSQFDVGIIPFLSGPLIQGVNPIKLYEYFACGMPVVTYDMPEMEFYSELIYRASSPDDFPGRLEAALEESDPLLRHQRRSVVERESWQSRCEQLLQIVHQGTFPQRKS